ncbi:hypothetical protein [Spiroplasma taiwanense]|uniref:Uncharacterized protein n=1 Tax=Spiroplasma taiwanense CT-1 TaxID=1276220 RepID=S5MBJ3_9MOLU|nr:hypothetical protein [Spiroplasma taiwanense]AGR41143.1 hypothetical protein STAIW_v1c05100 [Spiroplasma taiwanense CT-1]
MKKLLTAISSINIFSLSFYVISCGVDPTEVNYDNANHRYILENSFFNGIEENKKYFKLLPNLETIKEESQSSQLIFSDDNYLKFDCKLYNCSPDDFNGVNVSTDEYNSPTDLTDFNQILKIQTAYDELAYWFQIMPFSSEEKYIIYDFSTLSLNVDYSKNLYFFDKTEENFIKLFSQQILNISKQAEIITKEFNFIMEENTLNVDLFNKYLLKSTAKFDSDSKVLIFQPKPKNQINELSEQEEIEQVEYYSPSEIESEIKRILSFYQPNLAFKTEEQKNSDESNEEIQFYVSKKSSNLDFFNISDSEIVENIWIEEAIIPDPETPDPETPDPETPDPEVNTIRLKIPKAKEFLFINYEQKFILNKKSDGGSK